jgi:hypothetical protein
VRSRASCLLVSHPSSAVQGTRRCAGGPGTVEWRDASAGPPAPSLTGTNEVLRRAPLRLCQGTATHVLSWDALTALAMPLPWPRYRYRKQWWLDRAWLQMLCRRFLSPARADGACAPTSSSAGMLTLPLLQRHGHPCLRLFAEMSERVPDAELRLARETAASSEQRWHEECRGQPSVRAGFWKFVRFVMLDTSTKSSSVFFAIRRRHPALTST